MCCERAEMHPRAFCIFFLGLFATLLMIIGLIIGEITTTKYSLESSGPSGNTLTNDYVTICGWSSAVQCINNDKCDTISGYFLSEPAFDSNITYDELDKIEPYAEIFEYSEECDDDIDAACNQQTAGYLWISFVIVAIILGIISSCFVCFIKTRKCTMLPIILTWIFGYGAGTLFIITANDEEGLCWRISDNEDDNPTLAASQYFIGVGSLLFLILTCIACPCCINRGQGSVQTDDDW